MRKMITGLLAFWSSCATAAPDSYCPPYQKLIKLTADYANEISAPGVTDEQKAKAKKTNDTVIEILTMGYPPDVENFCLALVNREMLRAIAAKAGK